jgi:GR25 family glycosyltransferase involved in LPS biosynthesis
MGCALSHLGLWWQLANEKKEINNYLILEDDVKLAPQWEEKWKEASAFLPEDYDIIYLGGILPPNHVVFDQLKEPVNRYFSRVAANSVSGQKPPNHYFHWCAYSYVLSRRGAEKILQLIHAHDGYWTSADHILCNHVEHMKIYFLNPLIAQDTTVSVKESIDDLRSNSKFDSKFKLYLTSTFKKTINHKPLANHEFRTNSPLVRRRFRIYQILNKLNPNSRKGIVAVIKGTSSNISKEAWQDVKKFSFQISDIEAKIFISKSEFINFISNHKTKKRTQKALVADQPAPAALSIPDDACHYHSAELRTLSVREMARIQSFPDHFEFRSKITTGGKMRRFEVPQYTQVGNAVPPLLGRALGQVALNLLKKITNNT